MHRAVQRDEQGLAGRNVALQHVAGALQRHRFAGHQDGAAGRAPEAQRPDAEGVAKHQHAAAGDVRDHGVRAAQALVHRGHRGKGLLGAHLAAARGLLQFVRQHAQQHFGVAAGIDVPVVALQQLAAQGVGIGQVAVVHQHQAEGRAGVEGLRLFLAVGVAGRGVAHLAQAAGARQATHVAGAKHVAHHALGLVHEEFAALLRHDAGGILAAVLQQEQRVVKRLIDRRGADHADDATHDERVLN